MSDFIVSARKYRPATFRSVVGQKHITSTLQNAIERGQLAHAYLFCGPRGVGKTTCARIFAKAINCLHPHGAEACNECESCRSFNEGRSLNIHELDAASNNSVEDIRSLIEQVRIIPQVGRYSVFIIDEVHMLSAAAFNAFLKTLEEPPAHAIFILATTEKHKILPTILSRCQIYDFNRIRVEDSVEYLKYIASQEGITADEESLNLISQKADGGMRDALSMFDKAVSFCGQTLDYRHVAQTLNVLDYDTYFDVTRMLLTGNYVEALVTFDGVLSKGFSGQTFMAGLNRHLRDLLMAKRPETLRLIEMTGTLLERYRVQAEACSVDFLFGAIALLTDLDGKIRQSSNQRLLVELGLMKIAGLGQKKNNPLTSSGEYPLPDLNARPAAAAQPAPSAGGVSAASSPASSPVGGATTASTAAMPHVGTSAEPAAGTASGIRAASAQPTLPTTPAVHSIPTEAANTAPRTEPAAQTTAAPTVRTEPAPQPTSAPTVRTEPARQTPATQAAEAAALRENPAQPVSQPVSPTRSRTAGTRRKSLISGTSLTDLLASAGGRPTEAPSPEEAHEAAQTTVEIDPACASKLERAREQILHLIRERRPRFVAAFEGMKFHGNTITVSVPTQELREEMLRTKTAMLMRFAELAGVNGAMELEVIVNEEIRAARPIKLEDRVKHMTDKNPLLTEFRKALDLEVE